MYSGEIVDSRELASLERELGHHREQRADVEEQLLASMERLEALQSEMSEVSLQVDALKVGWESKKPSLAARQEQISGNLADLERERERLTSSLGPRSLDLYSRLRASSGRAVALVSGGICQSCRVGIPAKDVQHARSGALVTCTNCGRILHPEG